MDRSEGRAGTALTAVVMVSFIAAHWFYLGAFNDGPLAFFLLPGGIAYFQVRRICARDRDDGVVNAALAFNVGGGGEAVVLGTVFAILLSPSIYRTMTVIGNATGMRPDGDGLRSATIVLTVALSALIDAAGRRK